jgi:pimeloyl-ACP methyl ester carboxylesterase
VTTTTSARDLDRLRQALGVRRIDYYGLSYGTVLGSVYRQLFPGHVRSVVLDGAVDADLSLATDAAWEAPSIGAALRHDLSACAATGACALGPHPLAAFLELRARLARSSLPAPGRGDALPVTLGDLDTATLLYVSVPGLTPGYPSAVAAALRGDGAPLRSVGLGLETDLDGRSLVGPLWTITCNDAVAHPGGRETAALARALSVRQPLGGAEAVANNLIGCPGWPTPSGAVAPLSRVRAPAPVVIGNTVDPNTPYASARALAAAVGGRLVTVGVVGHTWLLNAATDPCMQRVVGAYLVDGTLPARGTRCPG